MSRTSRRIRRTMKRSTRRLGRGLGRLMRGISRMIATLPQRAKVTATGTVSFALVSVIALAIALPQTKVAPRMQEEAFQSDFAAGTNAPEPTPTLPPLPAMQEDIEVPLPASEEVGTSSGTAEEGGEKAEFHAVKEGDDGEVIRSIQIKLMELGYMDSDEPTQHFGSITKHALKCFQRHNGLDDDGVCGETTYTLLMDSSAKPYVMQLGDSGADVEGVQQRLYELGYLAEKKHIGGNFGEITEAAVREFQKKNKETADGKVGAKTLEALYDEDSVGKSFNHGDEDPIIEKCQTALKKLGYISFKPDGRMGSATVSAIKDFQEDNGLIRDGKIGPATKDLLLSGKAGSKVIQLGDSGSDVKDVQKRLNKLNYLSSGNVTGYFGQKTVDAVKAFQKRNGLGQDGKIGTVTLDTLNSSKAKKASSSSSSSSSSKKSSSSSSKSSSSSSSSSSHATDVSGVERLISLAESKLGCTYVRGAKGPSSFDCSGFVYWCLKNAGVKASYMTSTQWRTTSKYQRVTSMSQLERGDILVFSGEGTSVGHVGIYLGNGKMIDASSSAGVVRKSNTVKSGYWERNFICAYHVF